MAQAPSREFPVEWPSPEDAGKLWVWDGMHCPRPLTPLSIDFAHSLVRAAFELSGAPEDRWTPPLFANGFMYDSFSPPDAGAKKEPWQEEREARIAAEARQVGRLWSGLWLPKIGRIARFIGETDLATMSTPELIAHLMDCIRRAGYAFGLTLLAAEPMFHAVEQLYTFCEAELGAEGVALAGASIQGYDNASVAPEATLYRLAMLARELGLEGAFTGAPASDLPAEIARRNGGQRFLTAFEAAMDRFGWRTPSWFELSQPAWREDPAVPLRLIGDYLRNPSQDPLAALTRAARGRRTALRRLRAAFGGDKRERFEELWRMGRQFVRVSEGRALWQLSLGGYLRVPALALGSRLAHSGTLAQHDDVFYLRVADLKGEDPATWRHLAESRRAERESWHEVVPPIMLGNREAMVPQPAASGTGPALPFGARMVGGFSLEGSREEGILKGNAASPGLVTGTARVVESVEQADRVQPGDILVCRFTTPSWSHLFSRVSAIVADSGGVLSHCAILAREYAIPCVAGVRNGTRVIRDGMTITVDGTQGIVRLDG